MPGVGKITGALPSLAQYANEIDNTVLPGSLPRKKIRFEDLKYMTHNFKLKDGTDAFLRAGYDTNEAGKNIIRSLDISFSNKIKHIGNLELFNIKGLREVVPYIKELTTSSKTIRALYFLHKIYR